MCVSSADLGELETTRNGSRRRGHTDRAVTELAIDVPSPAVRIRVARDPARVRRARAQRGEVEPAHDRRRTRVAGNIIGTDLGAGCGELAEAIAAPAIGRAGVGEGAGMRSEE